MTNLNYRPTLKRVRGKWDRNKTSFASIDHGLRKSKHRKQTYLTQQNGKKYKGNVEDFVNK